MGFSLIDVGLSILAYISPEILIFANFFFDILCFWYIIKIMMDQDVKSMGNRLGLSRKTNVAIAAMTTLSFVQDSWCAIIAISLIGLVSLFIQGWIDMKKIGVSNESK